MLGFAVVGLQAWFCYVTLNLGSSSLEAIEDPQLPQMHNITKQGCLLNIQHHKTVCGVPFLLERSEIKWRANGNSCLDFSPEKKTTVTFHLSHLSFTIDFIKSVYILNIISIFNHLICFYFKEILGETSGTVLLRKWNITGDSIESHLIVFERAALWERLWQTTNPQFLSWNSAYCGLLGNVIAQGQAIISCFWDKIHVYDSGSK